MPDTKPLHNDDNLPTNIEQATPQHIKENLENWDKKILKMRAARLRVSEREAELVDDKPLFLIHAAERAKAEGCQVDSILQQYADEFVYSRYPTPECFLPDEVAEYVEQGTLPEERLSHTDVCSACSMLLAASLHKDIDEILAGVEDSKNSLVDGPDKNQQESVVAKGIRFLTDSAAIVLPVLLLAFGYGIFFLFDKRDALQTVLSDPLAWYIAIIGTFSYIAASRGFRAYPRVRRGTTGAIVGFVLGGFVYVNVQQIRSTAVADVALAFRRAQERTQSLALTAIQRHQTTGQFPDTKQAAAIIGSKADSGNLSVQAKNSEQAATYTLTAPNLRGQLVIQIGPDHGDIKWEVGGEVLSQTQVQTAKVESVSKSDSNDTPPTVTFEDGKSYKLVNLDGLPFLKRGAKVVAAIDPSVSSVEEVLLLAKDSSVPPRF